MQRPSVASGTKNVIYVTFRICRRVAAHLIIRSSRHSFAIQFWLVRGFRGFRNRCIFTHYHA